MIAYYFLEAHFYPKKCIYWEKWRQLMPDKADGAPEKKKKIDLVFM